MTIQQIHNAAQLYLLGKIKGETYEKVLNYFEKAKTGTYEDNSENRKLGRVGQKYGTKKQEIKKDSSDNYIGTGAVHNKHHVFEFKKYPQIKSEVDKSQTTESVYVNYFNEDNNKSITVRFSNHNNNAVKFGDQLDGNFATEDEVLYKLGLKERVFVPNKKLFVGSQMVSPKKLHLYEESPLTMSEIYALGAGADLSQHKGKVAKGTNYMITGDSVNEYEETRNNAFGQSVKIGTFKYSDIEKSIETDIEKAKKEQMGVVKTHADGTKWKKIGDTGSKGDWQQVKGDKKEKQEEVKETTYTEEELREHAKNSSQEALNTTIKSSADENLRKIAHEELDRRNKEEIVQEQKDGENKEGKNENEHVEKFRQLSDEQVKFYLDAPYPKVKDAARMVADERGLSAVSKEDYIKQFEDWSEKDNLKENKPFYLEEAKKIKEYLKENEDIKESLDFYILGSGHDAVRTYLSEGKEGYVKDLKDKYPTITEETLNNRINDIKDVSKNVSKLINDNKIDKDLMLHRRVTARGTFFNSLKEGDTYEDKSFSSTSLQKLVMFGDFNISILAKKGSNVANVDNSGEREYLIDKNSKFRVIEKHKDDLGIIVELL